MIIVVIIIQGCCPKLSSSAVLFSNTHLVTFTISLCFGVFTFFWKYKFQT